MYPEVCSTKTIFRKMELKNTVCIGSFVIENRNIASSFYYIIYLLMEDLSLSGGISSQYYSEQQPIDWFYFSNSCECKNCPVSICTYKTYSLSLKASYNTLTLKQSPLIYGASAEGLSRRSTQVFGGVGETTVYRPRP